jgi:hypothetical protein
MTAGEHTTRYVEVSKDVFTSEDGGKTFARNEGTGVKAGDPIWTVSEVGRQLEAFAGEELEARVRDGEPSIEQVGGVATRHLVAEARDLPSLAALYEEGTEGGTVEVWVSLGDEPTIKRLQVGNGNGKEAGTTLEWSRLGEAVAIETPRNIELSNAELIKKAAVNMQAADSYEVKAIIVMEAQTYKVDGQVDVANDLAKLDIDDAGRMYKLISVDGDVYLSADYGWSYVLDESGDTLLWSIEGYTGIWDYFTPEDLKLDSRPLRDGEPRTVTLGGVVTRHITVEASPLAALMSGTASGVTSGRLDLWISSGAKPYVYQMTIDSQAGGYDIKATLNWGRFNETFDIAAPPADRLPKPSPTAVAGNEAPPRITLGDFKALYDDPAKRPLILDVRSKALYEQGHIAGAVSFPESDMDARIKELPKDRLIVAYCQ